MGSPVCPVPGRAPPLRSKSSLRFGMRVLGWSPLAELVDRPTCLVFLLLPVAKDCKFSMPICIGIRFAQEHCSPQSQDIACDGRRRSKGLCRVRGMPAPSMWASVNLLTQPTSMFAIHLQRWPVARASARAGHGLARMWWPESGHATPSLCTGGRAVSSSFCTVAIPQYPHAVFEHQPLSSQEHGDICEDLVRNCCSRALIHHAMYRGGWALGKASFYAWVRVESGRNRSLGGGSCVCCGGS